MSRRKRADLHIHTTASDGTLSPQEVVRFAAQTELGGLAITDHDSVDGVTPGLEEGAKLGVIVVPAVEINTDYGKDEIHILGYYIDHESDGLRTVLENQRRERVERGRRMVEKLNSLGVKVSIDRVLEIAGKGAVGRPHVARAIVEAGYASSMGEAFGRYLIRGAAAYVSRHKLTPQQAIEIIVDAGGAPVLAHPGINRTEELIPELAAAGLKGLEVYHTEHSPIQADHFLRVASRYNLVPTGGSDSHGPNNMKTVNIGSVTVDISIVQRLKAISGA